MAQPTSTPMVSIQCLAYNHEKYIRQCLDGFVMQQAPFSIEAVVHEDASTDATASIIREYEQKHPDVIKPIYEKENLYQRDKQEFRRVVTSHLTGKYIAYCEGDDFWTDPDKLRLQVEFLESHPDYAMCFHSARKLYECDTTSWLNCEHIEDRDYSATELFVNWTVATGSVVCRREALEYKAQLKGAERILNGDISMILSCAMIGKIRGFHQQMSVYRIQGGGVTYDASAKRRRALRAPHHFECLKENFPIVDAKPLDDTIAKTYFERALVQDTMKKRWSDFGASFRYSPRRFLRMATKSLARKLLRK